MSPHAFSRELQAARGDVARALVGLPLELDNLTLAQPGQAGELDVFHVDEHLLAAIVRRNEAIALARVKELYDALCHACPHRKTSRSVHGPASLARTENRIHGRRGVSTRNPNDWLQWRDYFRRN